MRRYTSHPVKSTLEALEGNKVKLSIEVDESEFDRNVDAAFRKIARDIRLPGFRPGKAPRKIGSFTTASVFLGLDLGRLVAAPEAKDVEVQLVVANVFNRRPNFLPDAVLGFDPYNNPPNPRTVSVVFTKRFGR